MVVDALLEIIDGIMSDYLLYVIDRRFDPFDEPLTKKDLIHLIMDVRDDFDFRVDAVLTDCFKDSRLTEHQERIENCWWNDIDFTFETILRNIKSYGVHFERPFLIDGINDLGDISVEQLEKLHYGY